MARFNVKTYDPYADSSPKSPRVDNTLVLIYGSETECRCGCGESPKSAKRRFIQGHDARLKGALIRAAVAGAKVQIRNGKDTSTVTPAAAAKAFGFATQVAQAKDRYEARAKVLAERQATRAKATAERTKATNAKKAAAAKKAIEAKKTAKATKASKAPAKKAPAKRATKASAKVEAQAEVPTQELADLLP